MEIIKKKENNVLKVALVGRLDTNTSPKLEQAVKEDEDGVDKIYLDLKDLDYISSAGLRIVLVLHKAMTQKKGNLVVQHPKDEVMEVFDMTGFSSFLNIED
ncbi:MAG: STAS domain-containing protein [Acholeplasmatales bacterium]|nr:STAS domain-containing protein [Acholeplasmatales bacterium]